MEESVLASFFCRLFFLFPVFVILGCIDAGIPDAFEMSGQDMLHEPAYEDKHVFSNMHEIPAFMRLILVLDDPRLFVIGFDPALGHYRTSCISKDIADHLLVAFRTVRIVFLQRSIDIESFSMPSVAFVLQGIETILSFENIRMVGQLVKKFFLERLP